MVKNGQIKKILIITIIFLVREEWQEANIPAKVYTTIKAPVDLLFRLTIPVVDSDKPRDNWCQYLAIIQCVLGNLTISSITAFIICLG